MRTKQRQTGSSPQRVLLRAGSRVTLAAVCALLVAGCGLGSAKFGDPKIPPTPPPPAGVNGS